MTKLVTSAHLLWLVLELRSRLSLFLLSISFHFSTVWLWDTLAILRAIVVVYMYAHRCIIITYIFLIKIENAWRTIIILIVYEWTMISTTCTLNGRSLFRGKKKLEYSSLFEWAFVLLSSRSLARVRNNNTHLFYSHVTLTRKFYFALASYIKLYSEHVIYYYIDHNLWRVTNHLTWVQLLCITIATY